MGKYLYVLTALGGLAFGTAAAFLNSLISKKMVGKDNMAAIMGANFARFAIDIATLSITFLLCKKCGLPMTVALISAAVGLTVCGMLFLKGLSNKIKAEDNACDKDGGE